MKIIFVNRYYAPDHAATSQMLTDLAAALAAGGADVHVVTSRQRYDEPGAALAAREAIDGVTVHRVRASVFGRGNLLGRALDYLSFYVAASVALFRLARSGDIVVAKTDPPLISIPVGWVARLRRARQVNWLQDLFPEVATALGVRLAQGAFGRLLAWARDRSLRAAARNVVLSNAMRSRLVARNVAAESIVVVPNWADGSALRPIPRDANPLRSEWGLAGKFVVGYSGNMGRAHEFQTILDAAVALREERDIVFLFIGGGAQQSWLAQEAARLQVNAVFQPYQPREMLAQSLGVADAHFVSLRPELEGLVVPSKFYGILAVGRPVVFIGDANGELGREVAAAKCGFAVREGDAAGLVAAIRTLRDDAALCGRMGSSARRVFDEAYDKPIAIGKWRWVLEEVGRRRD